MNKKQNNTLAIYGPNFDRKVNNEFKIFSQKAFMTDNKSICYSNSANVVHPQNIMYDSLYPCKDLYGEAKNNVGHLLLGFIYRDFLSLKDFIDFINTWDIRGLTQYSNIDEIYLLMEAFKDNVLNIDEKAIKKQIKKLWESSQDALIKGQEIFTYILNLCYGNPSPELSKLTPLGRYCHFVNENFIRNETVLAVIENYANSLHVSFDCIVEGDNSYETLQYEIPNNRISEACYPVPEGRDIIIREVYYSTNVLSLCYFEMVKLLEHGTIKTCANCNKYSIPENRADEIYCNHKVGHGKTCKESGYSNKLKLDEAAKEYRQAYKTKHGQKQRLQKNNDAQFIKSTNNIFESWSQEANNMLSSVRAGIISMGEFKKFLQTEIKWR